MRCARSSSERALRATVCLLLGSALAVPVAAEEAGETARRVVHSDAVPAGPSVEARLREIQQRVQAAARYPEAARMRGAAGEVQVAFEIEPDGHPVGIEVVRSSGSVALDRAAERAVREAGALPRVIGRVNVPVHFALLQPD